MNREVGQGRLLNAWSLVHFSAGVITWTAFGSQWLGLIGHTVYEAAEGEFFPSEYRDRSMTNHVGDTLAFLAGSALAQAIGVGEGPKDD